LRGRIIAGTGTRRSSDYLFGATSTDTSLAKINTQIGGCARTIIVNGYVPRLPSILRNRHEPARGRQVYQVALGVTVLLRPATATLRRPAIASRPAAAGPGSWAPHLHAISIRISSRSASEPYAAHTGLPL